MSTWMKTEYRVVIHYNFLRNLSAEQCFEGMTPVLGEHFPPLKTITRWYKQFKSGDFSVEDDPRSGRPAETVTLQNVSKRRETLKRR